MKKPPKHLEEDLIAASVGQAFCIEFTAFLKVYRELPSPEEVFKNPRRTRIPEELSAQYAMACSLANAVSMKTFGKVLIYLERLPIEFNIMCVRDAAIRKDEIAKSKEFEKWLETNTEIIVA